MSLLTNRELILAKIESAYGTDSNPTGAANAILCASPAWSPEGARMVDRSNVKSTLAKDQQIYAGALRSVKFDVELKGSGTAGTPPELGPLLRACAMEETIVAATSVTYTPVSDNHESITIYYYQDGTLHKITGARGTFSFAMDAGGLGKFSFTFTGHDGGMTDTAIVTPTFDDTVPQGVKNVSVSLDGYAAVISSYKFDISNAIAKPSNISATDGYSEIRISGRDVNGSIDPEAVFKATKDYIGLWTAGTTFAFTLGPLGATPGNIVSFSHPNAYIRNLNPGDRDGLRTLEVTFGAAESTSGADDEIAIAFT